MYLFLAPLHQQNFFSPTAVNTKPASKLRAARIRGQFMTVDGGQGRHACECVLMIRWRHCGQLLTKRERCTHQLLLELPNAQLIKMASSVWVRVGRMDEWTDRPTGVSFSTIADPPNWLYTTHTSVIKMFVALLLKWSDERMSQRQQISACECVRSRSHKWT